MVVVAVVVVAVAGGGGNVDWKMHTSGMLGDMNAQRYIAEMHYDTQALCIW